MTDIANKILDLSNSLSVFFSESNDLGYILDRLKTIRKELQKNDKVFEVQNIHKVIGVSKSSLINLENSHSNPSYKPVFKLIFLYSLFDYNPLWIITKDNFFINKKIGSSESIYNKSSIEGAFSVFHTKMQESLELQNDALEELKLHIKQ